MNKPVAARRSRPLRQERDDVPHFVTCRVIEERFMLHPILTCGLSSPNRKARRACESLQRHADKRLTKLVKQANKRLGPYQPALSVADAKRMARGLVGSAVGRAQQRYNVKVFGLVVLSNHMHLLVQTTGKNLAQFMAYLKAAITRSVNQLTGRRGPLWARRYDAQPAVDDEGVADRMGYTVGNPVGANLVNDPEEWPGLNLAYGMGEEDELSFEYLDRTAWHQAKRPRSLQPFFETATLKLSAVPRCVGMSRELCRASLATWVQASLAKKRARAGSPSGSALGVEAAVHAAFDTRPRNPSRSRRPYVFGSTEARRHHRLGMMALMDSHRSSSERFRAGDRTVPFPEGTYPPPLLEAAR